MTVEAADVVISGAGPNGLMLACELALAGVRRSFSTSCWDRAMSRKPTALSDR